MASIVEVHAREIMDSRGNPTLEAEITLDSGVIGRAACQPGRRRGVRMMNGSLQHGPVYGR